jgi:hypothetical protein
MFIKLAIPASLCEGPLFYFLCWVFIFFLYAQIKRAYLSFWV